MIAERLTALAIRFPLVVMVATAVVTAVCAVGALRLRSESYLKGHLPPDDPYLADYASLIDEFGDDRLAVFAIGCDAPIPCADVFEPAALDLIARLDRAAREFEEVEEVHSLASAGLLVARDGMLTVERLHSTAAQDAAWLKRRVASDPLLRGTLVARDQRTALVMMRFRPGLSDASTNAAVLAVDERLSRLAADAGFQLHGSGVVLLAATTDAYVRRDLGRLTPLMMLLLAALLGWIFRHPGTVAVCLASVALPTAWAFGIIGWTGRPITPVTSTLPVLILVVGVTDVVHFLVRARELSAAGSRPTEILLEVAREVGTPTSWTALTSALGFLSFLAGSLPNLRDFGVFASVGIAGAWLLTFTLLPAALMRFPSLLHGELSPAFRHGDRVLAGFLGLAMRAPRATVTLAALTAALSLVGIARITAESDGWKLLGDHDPRVRSEHFVRQRFRSSESLEVLVQVDGSEPLEAPATLQRLEAIESALRTLSPGGEVYSVLLPLRVARRELLDGVLDLPRTSTSAAQLLLLLEAADADSLRRVVTLDHRLVRFSAPYATASTDSIRRDLERLHAELRAWVPDPDGYKITGSSVMIGHIGDLVLSNQVSSFSTAFLTIFAVIFLFVRSLPLGLLGMIPNVFPVLAILGLMGWAGINLDVATAMIASIVLGVSVDDTMYFLQHYAKARRQGATTRDAVTYTVSVSGKPALFCAGLLALGFFVLGLSSFRSLAMFGLLSGSAVLFAAGAELLLLPALLELTARRER
jgi:predicted RND superfamily exporter protein